MILLDTNVICEPMKPEPDRNVLTWLDAQDIDTLHISSTVLAELLEGLHRLPHGKRRDAIGSAVRQILDTLISSRVLAYDRTAAEYYADHVAAARYRGYKVNQADGQIASVAAVNGLIVATRDTGPFIAMGLAVIDPWQDQPQPQRMSVAEALAVYHHNDIELD